MINLSRFTNFVLLALLLSTAGCTGQLPGSFRYTQQNEVYATSQQVNTKIDLLFVVDNSASMDAYQQKLRNGFATFAQTYMKPTWDIQVAAITTDLYMAHPALSGWLNTVYPGTTAWPSPYVNGNAVTFNGVTVPGRVSRFQNPAASPNMVQTACGFPNGGCTFPNGIKFGDLIPGWGPNWAKLLPGLHDGPVTALCQEGLPYFLRGQSSCFVRDNQGGNTGTSHCLTPGGSESSMSQCVNTVENDTVHSGKAIIKTMPPNGTPGDAAWTQQLINDFTVNVSTGSAGSGSERGLGSVLQLMSDNEPTATAFFRTGSLRGIIFISDEEDQTAVLPSSPPAGFQPFTGYKCDLARYQELNPTATAGQIAAYCCSTPGSCTYVTDGSSCDTKTIDGFSYRVSICPTNTANLTPVATIKTQFDTFFAGLDGPGAAPNYFVTAIVPLTGASIQSLQTIRNTEDTLIPGNLVTWQVDRGDRYMQLGSLVGNGSLNMDIASSDYTPILNAIGQAIVAKEGTFTLVREPSGTEDMIVTVVHGDGTTTTVNSNQFTITGKILTITDLNFILSLSSTDRININYQPKNLN